MNILIIGSGGREYAIARRLREDKGVGEIFMAPGNGASEKIATNVKTKNYDELADFALSHGVDLTIVGPENALTEGVVDIFKARGLRIFGPSKAAARLEGSKAYMKEFLAKNHIKTARFINTDDLGAACEFIDTLEGRVVVKADGLCAGKGVIIATNRDEAKAAARDMLSGESFGDAGKRVVIEEYLDGFELSFFAICDGENFVSLPAAQDHKKLMDADKGPNTGGMGAYAPSPLASPELIKRVESEVVAPTLAGMRAEGNPFCGVLFVGLMIVAGEPYVLEFNVRFGDPECEVLMPLIEGDLSKLLADAADGKLEKITLKDEFAVGVVMASKNYPYGASKKAAISVGQIPTNAHIAYAGVTSENGELIASGGRVLVAVGLGKTIKEAQQTAYSLVSQIKFEGAKYRSDIAYQALR